MLNAEEERCGLTAGAEMGRMLAVAEILTFRLDSFKGQGQLSAAPMLTARHRFNPSPRHKIWRQTIH